MGTTMKGLLKGLRYISQIFEEGEDKEPEMEIGFPTDVKHVAHIGWDGPSTTAPTWMNEFKSTPLSAAVGGEAAETDAPPKVHTTEFKPTGDSPPPRPRSSRRKDSSTNPDSPGRESTKPSRRRPSTGAVAIDGNGEGSTRHGRRNRSGSGSGSGGGSSTGIESPPPSSQQDLPAVPKQSRRRKTKDSASGGSSRSSRNKAPESSACDERGVPELQALPSMPEREEVVHGGF